MRRVTVIDAYNKLKGEAIFHEFGVNYEEFETGAGNFTTAVIEWPDGAVENVPVHSIRFLDSP